MSAFRKPATVIRFPVVAKTGRSTLLTADRVPCLCHTSMGFPKRMARRDGWFKRLLRRFR